MVHLAKRQWRSRTSESSETTANFGKSRDFGDSRVRLARVGVYTIQHCIVFQPLIARKPDSSEYRPFPPYLGFSLRSYLHDVEPRNPSPRYSNTSDPYFQKIRGTPRHPEDPPPPGAHPPWPHVWCVPTPVHSYSSSPSEHYTHLSQVSSG